MLTTPLPSDLLVPIFRDARDMLLLTGAGGCAASSSAYLGILDYLREITRHSRLIARRIPPRPAPSEGPFFRI